MSIPNDCALRHVLVAGAFVLFACGPAAAHHGSGPDPAQAPALSTAVETFNGTIAQLVVENRVTNVTTRHLALHMDNGDLIALKGVGLDALSEGARVQTSGRVSGGNALFVTESTVVSPPSARSLGARSQGLTQVQGTLALAHSDDFANGTGLFTFVVRGDDGKDVPLKLPLLPDTLQRGMRVVATGAPASDGFSLDANNVTILSLPADQPPVNAPTTNNVLVILVKFTNSLATDPFTPPQVDTVFRTASNSVANYYNEVSYGQHLLNVTVASLPTSNPACDAVAHPNGCWLTATVATPANCDYTAIGNAGDAAATAAGYNLSNYNNKYYVMPGNGACGWAGLAYIGAPYLAWSNGYNNLLVYAHELGHNFGLYHAASLSCPGQIVGGPCAATEYGDPYSVMGNLGTMHFNAAQKADPSLQWISAASVQTHSPGIVNYTLSPLESPGGSTYAVKIPASSARTYWVEYRQPIGFDAGVPNNGAQVRVARPFEQGCGGCDNTEILDMSAGSGAYTLNVGQTLIDRATGVTISPFLKDASGLHVTVSKVNVPMLGDLDNDGSSDIFWQSPSTSQGAFWFMKLGTLSSSSFFNLPAGWIPQAVADVNGDGKADIIWTNPGSNLVSIWFMNGSTHGSPPDAFFGVPNTWSIAAVGDFNGDGRADILWRNVNGQIATWLMNGATIQSVIYYSNVDSSWTVLGTGDFFGDGKSEVVWKHSPDGTIYLWRNVDQTTPQLISLGAPGGTWQVAAIGDFNGDGKADLFLRDASGTNAIWPSGFSSLAVFPTGVASNWSVVGARQLYAEGRSNVLWRSDTGMLAQWRFNAALVPTGTFLNTVPLNWSPVGQ